jgi:uncharacterized protein YjbJ (UPF0337 family)
LLRQKVFSRQRVEGRGQRAEGRRQKAEGRGQKAEGRGQKAEGRRQRALGRAEGVKIVRNPNKAAGLVCNCTYYPPIILFGVLYITDEAVM